MFDDISKQILAQVDSESLNPDQIQEWLPAEYRQWIIVGGIGLLILLVIRSLWRRIARFIRRQRPPTIHPRLQKYNIDHAQEIREQEKKAASILATSTGNRLAGFRMIRQVEAVFVEGYRTPQEALTALKAIAAERGANAIINVKTERTSAGKCTGSGDAVVAEPIELSQTSPPDSAHPSPSK